MEIQTPFDHTVTFEKNDMKLKIPIINVKINYEDTVDTLREIVDSHNLSYTFPDDIIHIISKMSINSYMHDIFTLAITIHEKAECLSHLKAMFEISDKWSEQCRINGMGWCYDNHNKSSTMLIALHVINHIT